MGIHPTMGEVFRRETCECDRTGPVEVWTLQRARRANALNDELVRAILRRCMALHRNPSPHLLLITGDGDGAFCAGADLRERASMDDVQTRTFLALVRECFCAIEDLPMTTISVIRGAALGGGLELALCCNHRVADQTATLGLPEVRLGIIPGAGGTQRLARLVGRGRAWRLLSSGRRLDAQAALEWGLVDHLLFEGDWLPQVHQWAEDLSRSSPGAMRAAARALRYCDVALAEGLDRERRQYGTVLRSPDRREALEAFAEKREPRFSR